MHLVVPFAGGSTGGPPPGAVLSATALTLPRLERLLALLAPGHHDAGDEWTFSPPHERVLAAAWGWPPDDGLLPFAARAAQADGLPLAALAPASHGWALVSPVAWHAGAEQVTMGHPADLALAEDESRALFEALRDLFAEPAGALGSLALHWGAPTRWYAAHERLATLPTASLDRAIGRNVDPWLNSDSADARLVRRLQAEAQMLLHRHPVNAGREDRGLPPVNSVWLSGTGPLPPPASQAGSPAVDDRLRLPALGGDWAAWAEAWRALDAGPLAALLARAEAGEPVSLTLCGERHAQRFDGPVRRGLFGRLFGPKPTPAVPVLEAL